MVSATSGDLLLTICKNMQKYAILLKNRFCCGRMVPEDKTMTLKEIRINKGLTQTECAKVLGISLRTYQNYENDISLASTEKYSVYTRHLSMYQDHSISSLRKDLPLYTQALSGKELEPFIARVSGFGKRKCFSMLEKYINHNFYGKVCILYGLRRTGKTTLMLQMISELDLEECAYIRINSSDSMTDLRNDLETLHKAGIKYVFIDEVTLMSDFMDTAGMLADIFTMLGMKIVLSGTDSLGFNAVDNNELYDRNLMIHTTFIPFREYSELLGINSVDSYIEYGGTFMMENCNDGSAAYENEVSFRTDDSTRKYIDSSICHNIQHTLKNDYYSNYYCALKDVCEKKELTNIINRVVEDMNHSFLLEVIDRDFKSHDLGSAKNLLLGSKDTEIANALSLIDKDKVVERLKMLTNILNKNERKIRITSAHMDELKAYLKLLELIVNIPEINSRGKKTEHYVFAQPGMRYSITKCLITALVEDEYFAELSSKDQQYIKNKILDDVKGRMLEEIVLLEVVKTIPDTMEAFKLRFISGGEFDMVIHDSLTNTCRIYEIKHSDKADENQTRFLKDREKCDYTEKKYGKITGRYVLYSGSSYKRQGIEYINVEEFLKGLNEIYN